MCQASATQHASILQLDDACNPNSNFSEKKNVRLEHEINWIDLHGAAAHHSVAEAAVSHAEKLNFLAASGLFGDTSFLIKWLL